MARLTDQNVLRARETIALYPQPKSALLPLLHMAQEQDGWLTEEAMEHIAELLDLSPAEVLSTASFYSMFKREPVGKFLISVCTNIACLLNGGYELLEHAQRKLQIRTDATTPDKQFSLEEVECIAFCDKAPCLQVNYRFFGNVTNENFDVLIKALKAGVLNDEVPEHGVLNRVERKIPVESMAGGSVQSSAPSSEGAHPAAEEKKGNAAIEAQPADEESIATSVEQSKRVKDNPGPEK